MKHPIYGEVLMLTLKKKWFEMIASGEKKEEYRDLKQYWITRLERKVDTIHFKNGYSNDVPEMYVECKAISINGGKPEWGWDEKCFVIKLGAVLEINRQKKLD